MPPSSDPESTAPGITVTAAPCDARHVGLLLSHRRSCGPTLHTCSPVASFTARMPPGAGDSRSDTPKYAFSRSTAPPHCPPRPLPCPMRYFHTTSPSLSGSSAYDMPDFCGSTIRSRPFTVASVGEAEKSWSAPSLPGQFGLFGFSAWQPSVQLSLGVACVTHLITPLFMSSAITASVVGCD